MPDDEVGIPAFTTYAYREGVAWARKEAQERISALEEQVRAMTSAASSAAQTTVTAIERIQEMEKVVKAAENWAKGGPHAALTEAIIAWEKFKKTWS